MVDHDLSDVTPSPLCPLCRRWPRCRRRTGSGGRAWPSSRPRTGTGGPASPCTSQGTGNTLTIYHVPVSQVNSRGVPGILVMIQLFIIVFIIFYHSLHFFIFYPRSQRVGNLACIWRPRKAELPLPSSVCVNVAIKQITEGKVWLSVDSQHPDVIAIQRLVERMRLPSPVGQQTVDTQWVDIPRAPLDIHTINIVPTQTQNQCNLISERATLIGVWRNFKKKTGLYHNRVQCPGCNSNM